MPADTLSLQAILLQLLPTDHSTVGNITLLQQFQAAVKAAGMAPVSEDGFKATRDALVASGQAVKGKGRGGSTARATGPNPPDFALQAEPNQAGLPVNPATVTPTQPDRSVKPAKPTQAKAAPESTPPGEAQVLAYRHLDRRKNNPEVGLVSEASDPQQAKTHWAYDPHLDPALQFDAARASAEKLIEDALAGNDPAAMRHALETLRRLSAPYLQWTGKAERTSFEVDTVSLHVHERIDAMSILSAVSKRQNAMQKRADSAGGTGATVQKVLNQTSHSRAGGNPGVMDSRLRGNDRQFSQGFQPGLFEAPFESVPLRSALDFYKHDRGWANRLVTGDSLLVKEGMAGQVQMIYIDPPYGIKYGSNFQPFTNKRDVKDRSDADLTAEPEMIKAFRDTWELGIHSYLTYLRDRLLLARELLSETGSVFVQISDENLHHVRELCDEVFGVNNCLATIVLEKTSSASGNELAGITDYLVWYGKDKSRTKFNAIFRSKGNSA